MNTSLFEPFTVVGRELHRRFRVVPLLYGSLGLELATGWNFDPQDIDLLVPKKLITDKWNDLQELMDTLGYRLTDPHEHEFCSTEGTLVAFAEVEELADFARIDVKHLEKRNAGQTEFYLLNLSQYLAVYRQSRKDSYRKIKKNKQDDEKIRVIERLLDDGMIDN